MALEIELEKAAIKELGDAMTGPVMLSGHPDYDGARTIWNGMHDKRPALIARCMNNDDVANAVTFARERELLVAVRGGGHSWPGKSICDDGLMIDLSQLTNVTIDTDNKRAHVGGGALLGHLDQASLPHGLVTTAGVVSHTGVGGFTLGGGFGRLNRKYGLAVDNLRSAEIISADGQVRTASADENPDLFWALRGGGGNFGVVTSSSFSCTRLIATFCPAASFGPLNRREMYWSSTRNGRQDCPMSYTSAQPLPPRPTVFA